MSPHQAAHLRATFKRIAVSDKDRLNITALQGRDGYRLRFGGYRAVFQTEGKQINVPVLDAAPCGDIYK